ncbi:MAG: SPOR domain-containing protein [Pseudomonadota bacterium]
MDSHLKQRLVGALILIALAVVFWPIIFVSDDSRVDERLVVVPTAPPVDPTPLPEPDNAGLRALGEAQAQSQIVRDVAPPTGEMEAEDVAPDIVGDGAVDPGAESGEPDLDAAVLPEAGNDDDEIASLPPREETLPVATLDEARQSLTEPAIDDDGLPIAFSLQVATVGDRARAEQLRQGLIDAGYKAYMKRLRRDDRTLFRVMVGPKFQRDELVPIKAVVDENWRVDSLIIRYVP